MVLSRLKQSMLDKSLKKEQARAEAAADITMDSGPEICERLAAGKQINRHGLKNMRDVVRKFREGGPEFDKIIANMTGRQRSMYRSVAAEFKGEWMEMFEKLASSVPEANRDNPFAMSWDEWRTLGGTVGMNDGQTRDALRVMLVFRDR